MRFVICYFFSQICLFRNILSGMPSVSNNLDPDQVRGVVGPDLDTNCLQRFSADDTSYKQKVI